MLKITTSNGNVLVHADQQPDSYNGQSADGSTYMVHGGSWGKHKYIRKEGNRYIYPEDMSRKEKKRIKKADAKFIEESKNDLTPDEYKRGQKNRDQIVSAHQGSTAAYREDPTNTSYVYRESDGERQAALRKERNIRKKKAKEYDQISSAHRNATTSGEGRDEVGSYKTRTYHDTEKTLANKRAQKDFHKKNSERVSFETEFNKRWKEETKSGESKAYNLEKAKKNTAARKAQKEAANATEERIAKQLEKLRKRNNVDTSNPDTNSGNRPKSRKKKIIQGGKKVKTGKSAGGGKVYP